MPDESSKNLVRSFICIDFSDEIIKEVARIDELIDRKMFIGKFTELENLHLTLKFLGEIEVNKIEEIKKRLSEIKFRGFEIKLGEIGIFNSGKLRMPRIIWIKINGKELWDLQKLIDDKISDLFSKEERFMSHMTIARVKYVKDKKNFSKHIKNIPVKEIRSNIKSFKLKTSELRKNGPIYTDLQVYGLE